METAPLSRLDLANADWGPENPAGIETADMGTAELPGRHALDIAVIRSLSKRSDLHGLLRFGTHLAAMVGTGCLIWLASPNWWLMLPAMVLHGFPIVTMFAPMHECVHKTAFKSPRLNEVFGWIAGAFCFYNFHFYRRYHTWHHRYTQDRDRDPELSTPKPKNAFRYFLHVSGLPFWFSKPLELLKTATGRSGSLPFVSADSRKTIQISAAAQLGLYLALLVGSLLARSPVALVFWFLPAVLAQPLLRAILIAEHTGCSEDANGLTNTRTTLTAWPVRLLMWNMPFHAEHHLYPSIPFHKLAGAHRELRAKLHHLAPGYVAANRTIVRGLGNGSHSEPA